MLKRFARYYKPHMKLFTLDMIAAFIVACLLAWSGTAVRVSSSTGNGLEVAGNILSGIFHPSAKLLLTLGTDGVPYLLLETFCIAFLGTIVGAVISLPLSFLSASNLVPRGVALVGRVLIAAIRTIPAFVYGLMFIRVTGPGPFAGLLTMSLCSIGMVSKMFIESIEDLDKRILESLDAAGCTTFQKIRYGILPQLTADNVSALTVTAADGKSLSLTASEGVWLRSGQDVTQWSGKLTEALGQLTLLRCIDYRPSTGVAELCGLTEPAVTLTVTYRAIAGETELTLRVGAQRDGGYYATVNDDDTIYLLPEAPAEALAALAANGLNG